MHAWIILSHLHHILLFNVSSFYMDNARRYFHIPNRQPRGTGGFGGGGVCDYMVKTNIM